MCGQGFRFRPLQVGSLGIFLISLKAFRLGFFRWSKESSLSSPRGVRAGASEGPSSASDLELSNSPSLLAARLQK